MSWAPLQNFLSFVILGGLRIFMNLNMMRLIIVLGLVACCLCHPNARDLKSITPLFPAIFTFGDSFLDAGNNNYLSRSMAKANTLPNGIDFPTHSATGRFCNGRILVDLIAEEVGLDYAPPYLAPTTRGDQILQGVNYASGAAGILDDSGAAFIERLAFSTQISYFNNTVGQLGELLGASKTATLLAESLYFISLGTNDYIYNYLNPNSTMTAKYTLDQFHTFLASQLKERLKRIYNLGARKFAVNSAGPIGCMPARISKAEYQNASCVASENELAVGFNTAVQAMLPKFTSSLPGAMIVYANSFHSGLEVLQNADQGFEVSFPGCCAFVGKYKGQIPCTYLNVVENTLCTNRSKYLFWDEFHPSEAVNIILSQKLLSGSTSYITPMNLKELSQWTS